MRLTELVAAAYRTARARWVSSLIFVLLISALILATATTLGQALSAHQQVEAELESAGVRKILLHDTQYRGFFTSDLIRTVGSLNTVEVAYGTTTPRDVRNDALTGGGPTVPMWGVSGDLADIVDLVGGRWPQEHEALISREALAELRMSDGFGSVGGAAVVGVFTPKAGYESLAAGVLRVANTHSANDLVVVTVDATQVAATLVSLVRIVDQPANQLQIESPQSVADIKAAILGELDRTSRQQASYLLVIGIVLVCAVATGDVLLNRQDIGRRRALGASRSTITAYITIRVVLPALVGSALAAGVLFAAKLAQWLPLPAAFIAAICTLNLLAMTLAAIPPAVASSFQDPVRVLRTP